MSYINYINFLEEQDLLSGGGDIKEFFTNERGRDGLHMSLRINKVSEKRNVVAVLNYKETEIAQIDLGGFSGLILKDPTSHFSRFKCKQFTLLFYDDYKINEFYVVDYNNNDITAFASDKNKIRFDSRIVVSLDNYVKNKFPGEYYDLPTRPFPPSISIG